LIRKAHLLQPGPYFQAEAGLARVDQDGDRGAGAEELRYLGESSLDGLKRVLARDQTNRVLPSWNAARLRGGHANESAPPQGKIKFQAIAAGDDGAMQIGQARETDHGIDDLLPVWTGMGLNHRMLLNEGCSACHAARRGCALAAGV
jgi:phage/plasmid primase-like uncharacterized protein